MCEPEVRVVHVFVQHSVSTQFMEVYARVACASDRIRGIREIIECVSCIPDASGAIANAPCVDGVSHIPMVDTDWKRSVIEVCCDWESQAFDKREKAVRVIVGIDSRK